MEKISVPLAIEDIRLILKALTAFRYLHDAFRFSSKEFLKEPDMFPARRLSDLGQELGSILHHHDELTNATVSR